MDLHIFLVEHLPKTEKFKETEDTRYIYQKEIEKKCFQYDTAYVVYEYLLRKKSLTKYCMIRYFRFLIIHGMMDINKESPRWLKNVFKIV